MKDNFLNHNFDKLLLFALVLLMSGIVIHIAHHESGDMQAVTWAQGAFSTVLGALILILTGRVARSDGQTANGAPPTPAVDTPATPSTPIVKAHLE